jgi:hypothetical protein
MATFSLLPVEIVKHIASCFDALEDVSALGLSNTSLYNIINEYTEPGVTAYIAICSLELALITTSIRILGVESIKQGLTHKVGKIYALDRVVEQNRVDIFNLLEPFFTTGNKGILRGFQSVVCFNNRNLITLLVPYLSNEHVVRAIDHACLRATPVLLDFILHQVPVEPRIEGSSRNVELAVTSGRINLLRVLISGGARVNDLLVDCDEGEDRTVLHWLAVYGMLTNQQFGAIRPMVKMLCDAGADVNATDTEGKTALHYLAEVGAAAVKPGLLFKDDFTNERIDFVYECIVRNLIDAGADINAQDNSGRTPLHISFAKKERIFTRIVIQHGVNALITDDEGRRATDIPGYTIPTLSFDY